MDRMTWTEVEQRLKNIVVDVLGLDPRGFTLEDDWFQDIQADSLDAVEYIMACEESFGIEITDELVVKSRSVADAMRAFVREHPREVFDVVDTRLLTFRLRPDGSIEVVLQLEDGSWVYADGSSRLPSKIYVAALGKWAHLLADLESLVNDPNTGEQDLQDFFEAHPELMAGDDYDRVIPQAVISRDDEKPWQADFVLAPVNQTDFAKVVELKLPREMLALPPRSGHVSFSAKVYHAISQLKDYGRAFEEQEVRDRFRARYGVDVYKPDLQLIVGRKWELDWIDDLKALRKSAQVSVDTWDSVIDRLRRRLT